MKNFTSKKINRARFRKKPAKIDKEENISLQIILSLESLGCSVIDVDKNMSLLTENEDKILNPNIESKNISKNKIRTTDKSFPNESDPFYEVGTQVPSSKQNEKSLQKVTEKAKKVVTLVTDLGAMSLTG